MTETVKKSSAPLKSVAGALIFSVLLGPIGLLYSSTLGGALMIFLTLVVVSHHFYGSGIVLWLISCIWSVAAVNRYNNKILNNY